ncbi:S-layer homology domain-containing protein [Paenibacillus silvae]|uniref:S-layer homology domain-containing protein n=1 Tax=Paenibacillus silvae TaxID=1325358 RepID=UPI003CE7E365
MRRLRQNQKNFLVSLLACLLIIGGNPLFSTWDTHRAYASVDEEWALLGNAGFSAGDVAAPKLAVDQNGTTYVAFTDIGDNFKATVMKYSASSGWELVGDRGLSSGSASGVTLVLDQTGHPYISYQDSSADNKATVMKYSEDTGWQSVGEAGFTPNAANYPALALDQAGNPYIAFKDGVSGKATVMSYDSQSMDWNVLGSADFSPEVSNSISLVLNQNNIPYVAFQDSFFQTIVMSYESSNGWESVGQSVLPSGLATSPSLALSPSGIPYIASIDDTSELTVSAYNSDTSAWQVIGEPGFSPGRASSPSLQVDGTGTPFVAFKDSANDYKVTVMRYGGLNGWETVGKAGFSAGVISTPSLALDKTNQPYVVYQDAENQSKATVMRFSMKSSYTITYDGNGAQVGSVPTDPNQYIEQAGATVLDNTGLLEKTGYSFAGWNTAADGSGGSYAPGDIATMGSANITLYAQWVPNPVDEAGKWKPVGKEGFSEDVAAEPDFVLDTHGTPYIVYQDNANSFKATVMKYSEVTGWTAVGQPGFTSGSAFSPKLAIAHDGTIYVAFKDGANMFKATVMKYSEQAGWQTVGNAGFSQDSAQVIDLALGKDGTPYVAVIKTYQLSMMKYNEHNDEWLPMNIADYNSYSHIYGVVLTSRMDGKIYVAYTGGDGNSKASVVRYDEANGSWLSVGNRSFTDGQAIFISPVVDQNGTVYIAYRDVPNGNKVSVMKNDGSGTWTKVGMTGFSDGMVEDVAIALDPAGSPYVVYKDWDNQGKATVKKYGEADGWTNVGNAGFSKGVALILSLAVNSDGTVYAAYCDNGENGKATVMSYTEPKTYKVTYNSNEASSGNVPVDSQSYHKQSGATILDNTGNLAKFGYTFAGWNTKADGSGQSYNAGDTLVIGTADVILYASWTPSNNGGSGGNGGNGGSNGGSNNGNGGGGSDTGSGNTSGGGSTGGSGITSTGTLPSSSVTPNTGVSVLVNGKPEIAGTLKTTRTNGQNVLTLSVDAPVVMQKLESEGTGAVVTLPVNSSGKDVVIGKLTGQLVKHMGDKKAVLVLQTAGATYSLPSEQVDINALAQELGANEHLQDMIVSVKIEPASADTVLAAAANAQHNGYALVGTLYDYSIVVTYGDKSANVDRFSTYVKRDIALSSEVDPARVTTGIVVEADGSVRHVPTKITQVGGVYHAQMNSLTNSTYGVIWNPRTFTDVDGHWAQTDVNDLASRLVLEGVSDDSFSPNTSITRAEFAAVLVRALGLRTAQEGDRFGDMKASDWYAGAVSTASGYGLIDGYKDGTFRPAQQITREEAMLLMNRAFKLAGADKQPATDADGQLSRYADKGEVSAWAKEAVMVSLQAGLVSGRSSTILAPKATVTRAETAALVRRMLQLADLI